MMKQSFLTELGLNFDTKFLTECYVYLAILAAPLTLLMLTGLLPLWHQGIIINSALLFSFIIWQPIIEELLFRGLIQGQLIKHHWMKIRFYRISLANGITTLLFMSIHLIHHSVFWALSVILPSLVFGYFRDRYSNIYPSLVLHSIYNACYLLAVVVLNQ